MIFHSKANIMERLTVIILALLFSECLSAEELDSTPCILVPLRSHRLPAQCEITLNQEPNDFDAKTVKIVPVSNMDEYDIIINFVANGFKQSRDDIDIGDDTCSEVIGVVGDVDSKTVRVVNTLSSRADLGVTLVSAVTSTTFLPTANLLPPNVLEMYPLRHYMDALITFFAQLDWTRIGLISDGTPYHQLAAEMLQQRLRFMPYVRIREGINRAKTIRTFEEYGTDVIVVSASGETACSLVQAATQNGFKWPQYAWIVLNIDTHLLPATCRSEGVIFLQDQNIGRFGNLHTTSCSNDDFIIKEFLKSSIFQASLLAILSPSHVHTSHSASLSEQVEFKEGKRLNTISIVQIRNTSLEEITFYNSKLNVIDNFSIAGEQPRGRALEIRFSDTIMLPAIFVVIVFLFVFAYITVILILYIIFRKEPEVKATSFSVSLCLFLACYTLVLFLPLQLSSVQRTVSVFSDIHCNLLAWDGITGVPFALILSTLFVKMLRVYLIFFEPHSYKKKLFSDAFLLLYIVTLMLPVIIIHAGWSGFNPLIASRLQKQHKSFLLVHVRCVGPNTIYWLGASIGYNFLLSTALVCLAVKTANIRFKHFRDTKATNAFTFLACFIAGMTLTYWYFFRLQGLSTKNLHTTSAVLYIGYTTLPVTCQTLLFAPKVYPPLKRRLAENVVKSKTKQII
jgi:hypothetical protein